MPGVLACGTASARPFVGYSEGVLLTEHAGTEALGLLWVVHSVRGRAANWEWRERPCSRSGSLEPLVALLQGPVMCMHMS